MLKHIVTNWENELTDVPEPRVMEHFEKFYKGFELKILSGFRHRTINEIYETLNDSFAIIAELTLLDERQITDLVRELSHLVWINFNSNTNNLSVRHFNFISSTPFEDMIEIKRMCMDLKDEHGEPALVKIVKSIRCSFYGFNGEHYEMDARSSWVSDIQIIRIK